MRYQSMDDTKEETTASKQNTTCLRSAKLDLDDPDAWLSFDT